MANRKMMIATVVVTYNRLNLLKECITGLRNQTKKVDEIVVVNNSSTDGTEEWLKRQTDITTITQRNLGGAGGFYTGTKYAFEKGFDWIWLMDDDGIPDNNALNDLTKNIDENLEVLNSLVVSNKNSNDLVFGVFDYLNGFFYKTVKELIRKKYIYGANFFNGTLISKDVINIVGFPNPIFFIYGDEAEYYHRLQYNNIQIRTITASKIYHPKNKTILFGKGKLFYNFNFFNKNKAKYLPRNQMIIFFLYDNYSLRRLIKIYILDMMGIVIFQKDLFLLVEYFFSILKGITFFSHIKERVKKDEDKS